MPHEPGKRRQQILQALASMLEGPESEKITTALLADKLQCSEAALYRHFASKAQMFNALIDFIESSLFSLINQIGGRETPGLQQAQEILHVLLAFAEKNRGMARVLIGEALVHEKPQLQERVNDLHDKLESAFRQKLRVATSQQHIAPNNDVNALANLLLCFAIGRWAQYVKSGFQRTPLAQWEAQWTALTAALRHIPAA